MKLELGCREGRGLLAALDRDAVVLHRWEKSILIGKAGQKIKSIGTAARGDLETFLGRCVYLDLQVKLEPGWREDRGCSPPSTAMSTWSSAPRSRRGRAGSLALKA